MTTQPTLPFDHGLDFTILDSQPDPAQVAERLAQAHELCEYFRRDKAKQMAAIKKMLADDRIKLGSQIEHPSDAF